MNEGYRPSAEQTKLIHQAAVRLSQEAERIAFGYPLESSRNIKLIASAIASLCVEDGTAKADPNV